MNTIPTTTKQVRVPYTVVGGEKLDKKQRAPYPMSMIILNRSGQIYKADTAAALDRCGIDEIISVETVPVSYDLESLTVKYPRLRFLVPGRDVSPGEKINIAVEESHSELVLVVWDDIRITAPLVSAKVAAKVNEGENLVTVPLLQNSKRETLPTMEAPAFYRKKLKVVRIPPRVEGMDSLYPFDYIGIYHKQRFIQTGGYDSTITTPHWQKLDFGFRAHMWGEKIKCNTSFLLHYLGDVPPEDESLTEGYRRFFLKNLAVRFNGDTGSLPKTRFLPLLFRGGTNFLPALQEFRGMREWVELNKYRFKQDARSVTELWEIDEK